MIVTGLILIVLALFLPAVVAVPSGLDAAAWVLGIILVIVGLVLYLAHGRGYPWGRRYY